MYIINLIINKITSAIRWVSSFFMPKNTENEDGFIAASVDIMMYKNNKYYKNKIVSRSKTIGNNNYSDDLLSVDVTINNKAMPIDLGNVNNITIPINSIKKIAHSLKFYDNSFINYYHNSISLKINRVLYRVDNSVKKIIHFPKITRSILLTMVSFLKHKDFDITSFQLFPDKIIRDTPEKLTNMFSFKDDKFNLSVFNSTKENEIIAEFDLCINNAKIDPFIAINKALESKNNKVSKLIINEDMTPNGSLAISKAMTSKHFQVSELHLLGGKGVAKDLFFDIIKASKSNKIKNLNVSSCLLSKDDIKVGIDLISESFNSKIKEITLTDDRLRRDDSHDIKKYLTKTSPNNLQRTMFPLLTAHDLSIKKAQISRLPLEILKTIPEYLPNHKQKTLKIEFANSCARYFI